MNDIGSDIGVKLSKRAVMQELGLGRVSPIEKVDTNKDLIRAMAEA